VWILKCNLHFSGISIRTCNLDFAGTLNESLPLKFKFKKYIFLYQECAIKLNSLPRFMIKFWLEKNHVDQFLVHSNQEKFLMFTLCVSVLMWSINPNWITSNVNFWNLMFIQYIDWMKICVHVNFSMILLFDVWHDQTVSLHELHWLNRLHEIMFQLFLSKTFASTFFELYRNSHRPVIMTVRSITVIGTITQQMKIGIITIQPMVTVMLVSTNVHRIRTVGPSNVGLIIVLGGEMICVELKTVLIRIWSFLNMSLVVQKLTLLMVKSFYIFLFWKCMFVHHF